MIYHGKTIRLANLTQGFITGETQSTLNIDCDILSGASSTMARCSKKHSTLKSWSADGEVILDITQFIAFCEWLTQDDDCMFAFTTTGSTKGFSLYGRAIITTIKISAPIKSVVKIQFKVVGSGKPEITIKS